MPNNEYIDYDDKRVNIKRSICLGCNQLLQSANAWCPCVDAEEEKTDKLIAASGATPPDQKTGFVAYESVLPARGSLKGYARMGAILGDKN